eukprot:2089470-Rhodomonas_salina.1
MKQLIAFPRKIAYIAGYLQVPLWSVPRYPTAISAGIPQVSPYQARYPEAVDDNNMTIPQINCGYRDLQRVA